jgi:serine protease AprX
MNKKRSYFHLFLTLVTLIFLLGATGITPAARLQPVIVQGYDLDQAAALVEEYGGQVTSRLEVIGGLGARVPAGAITALRGEASIRAVTPNAPTRLTASSFTSKGKHTPETDYPDVTGADLAWQDGVVGAGVGVAVIDTGIALHPALMKDPAGRQRPVVAGWIDFVEGRHFPVDPNGHGTHIAGIIANASKGQDGEYNGVAPGASLVGVRVLDRTGAGNYEKVIQGIQWVIENKDRYNIRVLNLSLYSLVQSPYWADPLNQAVMRAWAEGIVVVAAAGNGGPNPMTVSVPGNVPYVLTVGAFTDNYTPEDWSDDFLAEFSSAGPTLDAFAKPDLLAPGAHITSTMLPGSYIARHHEANWVDGLYFAMAGTSQAAAVVSGAAALAIANNPNLAPDQVKYRLMVTALPWINAEQTDVLYSVWQQGAGRLNAYDAALAGDVDGAANQGLSVWADLDGSQHFEGYSYFDETTETFRLRGFEALSGGYGSWAGGYGSWAGGYGSWAGGYGSWAGGYGSWAGGYGSWAGGYGSWAGGYGSWAGGYGSWAGGYGSWAGGYGSWAGGYGSWAGRYYEPEFFEAFRSGVSPDVSSSAASLRWVAEP